MTPKTRAHSIMKKLLLGLLLSPIMILVACDQPVSTTVKTKILNDISNKVFDLYDGTTGQQIDFTLAPDKDYYLAVNTSKMAMMQNRVVLYFKHFRKEEPVSRLVEFRLDPSKGNQDLISVGAIPDNLKLWSFNINDRASHQEIGHFQVMLAFQSTSSSMTQYAFDHYNFKDHSPDEAIIVNGAPPIKKCAVNVGYYGMVKAESEIMAMINELVSRFSFATKNYGQMTVNYLGRHDYPADNTTVAGKLHDYTVWWSNVSHNLAGTDLLPLDPADSADLSLIKMAWYDALPNRPQLAADIKEAFNTASLSDKTVIFVEAPYWAAGGSYIAKSPIYNHYGFMQTNSGNEQWGKHKSFGPLPMADVQKIALHELGHLYGMAHPPKIQEPSATEWTVQVATNVADVFGNLMHQGSLKDYSTDLFYIDQDIQKALQPELDLNSTPKLAIPYLDPVGDPQKNSTMTISGQKQAGSSIVVNNVQVVAASSNTVWSTAVNLIVGENRFDIAQVNNGQTSHPFILYVSRLSDDLPAIPNLILSKTLPSSNTVVPGGIIIFEIEAQAQAGLKAIWWWLEKKVNTEYIQVKEVGHWHDLYGAVRTKRIYKTSLLEPGEYKLRARARDNAYPTTGEEHQSNIGELLLTVQ